MNLFLSQANSISGTIDVQETKTPLLRSGSKSTQSTKLSFSYDRSLTASSSQGYLQIDGYSTTPADSSSADALAITTPIRISYRSVDATTYIKIAPLLPLAQALGLSGSISKEQLAPYENWLRSDLATSDAKDFSSELSINPLDLEMVKNGTLTTDLKAATVKRISPIRILSTSPVTGQEHMIRIRAKANPAFVTFLEQQDLKRAGRDAAKKKDIQALYKKIREATNQTTLVFLLDTKDAKQPTITRIEFASNSVSVNKGCGYARYTKAGLPIESSYSCNLSAYRTSSHVTGGINIIKKDNVVIEAPVDTISLKDTLNQLFSLVLGGNVSESSTPSNSIDGETSIQ